MFTNQLGGLHPDCETAMLVREPEGHFQGSLDEHYSLCIDLEFINWDIRPSKCTLP